MRAIFIFGLFISFVQLQAQIDLRWDIIVEGNGGDLFSDVNRTPDGGCILIASSNSTDGVFSGNHGARDGYIAKYDIDGNLSWDYVFGGSQTENLNDIVSTNDGGFIVVGSTSSSDGDLEGLSSASNLQELLIKFSDDGQIEWVNKYSNGNTISAKTDSDGNIYIITRSGSLATGTNRLSKIDSEGNRLWSNSTEGSAITDRVDVTVDDNGNVYQLLAHTSTTNGNDFRIRKFDESGNELWSNTYGGAGSDGAHIIEIREENLLVAGSTVSTSGDIVSENGSSDGFIASIDFDGTFISSSSYGGTLTESIDDMKVVGNKVFICGISSSTNDGFAKPYPGSLDIFIAEIDLDGNIVWLEFSGGSAIELRSGLDIVNDTMLVLGFSSTSQDGNLEGADEDDSIYLAYYDYHDLVSTKDEESVNFAIYPNPTASRISIALDNYLEYGVRIYDMNGSLLMEKAHLLDSQIDISNLPQGQLNVSLMKEGDIVSSRSIFKK